MAIHSRKGQVLMELLTLILLMGVLGLGIAYVYLTAEKETEAHRFMKERNVYHDKKLESLRRAFESLGQR